MEFTSRPQKQSPQLSKRATAAALAAIPSQSSGRPSARFPSGPTFSVEFNITWPTAFFDQFEYYAIPWRCGVYGYGQGWLWMGQLFHTGPASNHNQPIVQHSPPIEFGNVTSYAAVVDIINGPFPAEDEDGHIYQVDHEPVVVVQDVEGGGVLPVQMVFDRWSASISV